MDSLIEKYGIKKVLFVIGSIFLLLFLILFIIKRINNGDKKLLECKKNVLLQDVFDVNDTIKYYKNDSGFKLSISYEFDFKNDFSSDAKVSLKNNLENSFSDFTKNMFQESYEYVKTEFNFKNSSFFYKVNVDVTKDNQYLIDSDLGYDIYNMSVDEIKNRLVEEGFECSN